MHDTITVTGAWVKQMLQGHLNYYAVSGNHPSTWWFCNQVRGLWLKTLRRRSQKADLSWERFVRLVERFFPPIKTLHPLCAKMGQVPWRWFQGRKSNRRRRRLGFNFGV
jgi:RNA-directed DNA polymerase